MKGIIFSIALLLAAQSAKAEVFIISGKTVSKIDAVKALLQNPNAEVLRACPLEISSKFTLRCKKHVAIDSDKTKRGNHAENQ